MKSGVRAERQMAESWTFFCAEAPGLWPAVVERMHARRCGSERGLDVVVCCVLRSTQLARAEHTAARNARPPARPPASAEGRHELLERWDENLRRHGELQPLQRIA